MQGTVAISPSPVTMENLMGRQQFGLSLRSVQSFGQSSTCHSAARCLFGPPDVKLSKDLVREVELKNCVQFGKRFNFDIVEGEPFPSAKRMRMSDPLPEPNDSDEENVAMIEDVEEKGDEGYLWTEVYDEDYMAACNKHALSASIVGPNRHAVSLFYAPTIPNHHGPAPVCSSSLPSLPSSHHLQQSNPSTPGKTIQKPKVTSPFVPPVARPLPSVHNNNTDEKNNNNEPKKISIHPPVKKSNRINRIYHPNPPSAKKTSLSHITKYTNRVLKHAVMKKPKKSIITDFLQIRRLKSVHTAKKGKEDC